MGGSLIFTFTDIYMVNVILIPSKRFFYRRFVDDIYSRRKIGDIALFNWLNNYYPNIKRTIELNPNKFLDIKLTDISGFYRFNVYHRSTKLLSPWTSYTPKRYK